MARTKQIPRRSGKYLSPTHVDGITMPTYLKKVILDEGFKKLEEDFVRAKAQCTKMGLPLTDANIIKLWRLHRRMDGN